jgi:sirohydrochlorin ferrochelatase
MHPETLIEYAFLSFSEKTLEKCANILAEKGAAEIKIIPFFLFAGTHVKDISRKADVLSENYPEIKFTTDAPLSNAMRLSSVLLPFLRPQKNRLS